MSRGHFFSMFKRITFASVGIVLFAFPLIASAACVDISSTLRLGSRGAEVSALQTFFVDTYQDFPAPTGYFGPTTQAALRQWQSERGIVSSGTALTTGYGVTGPKTRAALACTSGSTGSTVPTTSISGQNPSQSTPPAGAISDDLQAQINALLAQLAALQQTCPSTPVPASTQSLSDDLQAQVNALLAQIAALQQSGCGGSGITFTATPTSGKAPLAVVFSSNSASDIKFGDGTTGTLNPTPICTGCAPSFTASHIYTSAGVFTASANGITTTVSVDSTPMSYKSYPTVALDTLPSMGLSSSDGRLMRLKITAAPSGGIGIGELTFTVTALNTNSYLTDVKLYAYTDSSYSNPVRGQNTDGSVPLTLAAGDPSIYTMAGTAPIQVAAGQTVYLELRGNASGTVLDGGLSTTLLGESVRIPLTTGLSAINSAIFVWSPNTNSISTYQDADWTSGGSVVGLPASGITQTRTASSQITSIGITSPTSGAIWTSGNQQTVYWTSNVTTGNVGLFLTQASNGWGCLIGPAPVGNSAAGNYVAGTLMFAPAVGYKCPNQNMTLAPGIYYVNLTYPYIDSTSAGGLYQGVNGKPVAITLVEGTKLPSFTATPASGTAPLTVTLAASKLVGTGTYSIDYGDGQNALICKQSSTGVVNCGTTWKGTHVYTKSGTYIAKLSHSEASACTGGSCATSRVVATATVTVNSTAAQTPVIYSLSPVSGPGGTKVSVTGANFGSINTILFNGTIPNITSSDGKQLSFTVPVNTPPGSYGVSVTNNANNYNSNTMTFTVSGGQTGALTVASSKQPPNSLAPQYSISPFTRFTLANTGSTAVTVTSLIVQNTGVAPDAAFNAISVWNEQRTTKLGGAMINTNHQANVSTAITINPGETQIIEIDGDMAANLSAYAGQTANLSLVGIGTTAFVSGTLPVSGATQTVNASLDACSSPDLYNTYGYKCWMYGGGGSPVTLTVSPLSGTSPLNVKASFTLSSACNTYSLDWGGGNSQSGGGQYGCSNWTAENTYTLPTPEAKTYTVTVKDTTSGQSASQSISVKPAAAPSFSFVKPPYGPVVLVPGTIASIVWTATPPAGKPVSAYKVSFSYGPNGTMIDGVDAGWVPLSVGTATWNIPSYVTPGTYNLKATIIEEGPSGAPIVLEQMSSPFTIAGAAVPKVDIKVNGSDGPLSIPVGGSGKLSWTLTNVSACSIASTVNGRVFNTTPVTASGEKTLASPYALGNIGNYSYAILCGGGISDSVSISVILRATSTSASAETLSQLGSVLTALRAFLESIQGR